MKRTWWGVAAAVGAAAALSATLVAGTAGATPNRGVAHPAARANASNQAVAISDEYGETWPCEFNPYNSTDLPFSFGPVYEELVYVDDLESGKTTPWLAKSFAWSNGNKTLSFTIRSGVKWSSGKPFSAKDVLFSFDLLKKYPALDLNADWSVLKSVSLSGSNKVVFQFKTAAVPYFFYIADETPIVPQYIWSKVKNPVTYLDSKPIGTGAFVMSKCSATNIQYTANKHYWQMGEPKIKTVNFPAYLSNTPANEDLASGKDQWGSQFIPSIKSVYLSHSKYYHYWFEPVANVSLFLNLTNPLLKILDVRKAIAYAIDRPRVSQIGEYGYEPPSNQTGIVKPTYSSWYDSSLAAAYGNAYKYNPKKAVSLLKKAGFKKNSSGIYAKGGKELNFNLLTNGGYSDWVASVDVIKSDLAAVGIKVTPVLPSNTTFLADLDDGHFDLGYNAETGGPTPYYELRQMLYGPNSAPIGKSASTNWERYISGATDSLIDKYASTTSSSVQHNVIDQLERVMLADVPVIPVTEEVDWYQYDTQNIGGWVTKSDPYAQPAQYATPDWGVVLLHLYFKKK